MRETGLLGNARKNYLIQLGVCMQVCPIKRSGERKRILHSLLAVYFSDTDYVQAHKSEKQKTACKRF